MIILYIGIGFIVVVLAFLLVFGHVGFNISCKAKEADRNEKDSFCGGTAIPEEAERTVVACREWYDGSEHEDVSIISRDGLTLNGRLILHTDGAKGTVIFMHGYHSSCRRDLAVQMKAVYDGGYDVLAANQRCHGSSEGNYVCFGAKERYDLLLWSEYVSRRFSDHSIALMGLSMGGATVMMSSDLKLPEKVKCLINDCGFTSPWDITVNTLKHSNNINPYPLIFFMDFWCIAKAHYSMKQSSALKSLKKNTRPVLMIHGELDTFVPTQMSHRNAAVNKELIELMIVPTARHAQSIYYDTDGYIQRLISFLNEHM